MKRQATNTIAVLFALLAMVYSITEAQQQTKIYRVAFLGDTPPSGLDAFRSALRELGWVEGRNVAIEYRPHDGQREILPTIASELVNNKVDLIVAPGTGSALAAKEKTKTVPILMFSSDPLASGLVASLARPGGNITGFNNIQMELGGKRLEILKDAFPSVSRVAVILRQGGAGMEQQMSELDKAAASLHVELIPIGVVGPSGFDTALSRLKKERASGLTVLSSPFFNIYRDRILKVGTDSRLPAIYPQEFAEAGGLMSYGLDQTERYRRVAVLVDKILEAAKPADLPVEQPTKFELVINLKTAKQIGLSVPPNVLARADRVIR